MLAVNLKNAREKLGLSQEDVAKAVGITQPAYSYFESGFKIPSVVTLAKISSLLKVSMDELVKQYDIRPGVGIAAPQVGVNKRMFAINAVDFLDEKQTRYLLAIINPVITHKSKEMTYLPGGEGCLSVDRSTEGLVTPRHYAITAKCAIYDFKNNRAKNVTLKLEGYPAIVFQHEYDHLDGTLYTDKMYKESELPEEIFPLFEPETDEEIQD